MKKFYNINCVNYQKQKWPTMNKELNAFLFLEIKKKKPKGLLSKLMEKLAKVFYQKISFYTSYLN